ncbi:MAG: AraC family transcriptional regulator [Pseudomonadota bacterium]
MKNNFLNIHDVIMIVSILESVFLCAFFGLISSKQRVASRILAFLFLLVAGTLISELIIWNAYLQPLIASWTIAPAIVSACLLLEGPTLYLYLHSLSSGTHLWRWSKAIHLLPALVSVGIILVFNITLEEWLPSHWATSPANSNLAIKFLWAAFKSLPVAYVIACFYAERRRRQEMKQLYSSISQLELLAVDIVLAGFFLRWFWSFIGYVISGDISSEANNLVGNLNNYLTAVLLNTLFVFGLVNTRQLNMLPTEEEAKPAEIEPPKEKIAAIERGIQTQKLHLNSDINLKSFSEQIGLRPRDVSNIINSHYGSNFFEFINRFRIEEAKRLLMVEDSKDVILDIVYKCGFNSPSAFHRFFKRVVGIPPSKYRNREKAATEQIS